MLEGAHDFRGCDPFSFLYSLGWESYPTLLLISWAMGTLNTILPSPFVTLWVRSMIPFYIVHYWIQVDSSFSFSILQGYPTIGPRHIFSCRYLFSWHLTLFSSYCCCFTYIYLAWYQMFLMFLVLDKYWHDCSMAF